MANLTRLQMIQLIKSGLTDTDGKLDSPLVAQYIIQAHRKAQIDLMHLEFKHFTKVAILENSVASCPSDLIALPNSIISVKASAGVRASGQFTFGSGQVLTITAKEPTTGMNAWVINLADTISAVTPSVSVWDYTGKTMTIQMKSGTVTSAMILSLFTTDLRLNKLFTATFGTAGTLTLTTDGIITLASGTGSGYKPAREYPIEHFDSIIDNKNNLQLPTVNTPIYKRYSNSNGSQVLEFYPATITVSEMNYYYLLPSMSADSSTSGFPEELEELIILGATVKCYEKLKMYELAPAKQNELDKFSQQYTQSYEKIFTERFKDKMKLANLKQQD